VQPPELLVELLVGRQLALRRDLVDDVRKDARDRLDRLVLADPALRGDARDLVVVERAWRTAAPSTSLFSPADTQESASAPRPFSRSRPRIF